MLNQGLNPRTVWGLVQGVTDYAHEIKHTDTRVDLERKAGGRPPALSRSDPIFRFVGMAINRGSTSWST